MTPGTVEVGEWDNPKGVAIYHPPAPPTVPRSPVRELLYYMIALTVSNNNVESGSIWV